MTTADYASMGRLGTRTPLLPRVPAKLVLPGEEHAGHRRHGLLRRRTERGQGASTAIDVVLVDYSVTGVGFVAPPDLAVPTDTACRISLDGADTHVRVIGTHRVGGELTWGAMFLDPRPDLLRAIESGALHRDLDGEEARWNSFGD